MVRGLCDVEIIGSNLSKKKPSKCRMTCWVSMILRMDL